MSFYPAFDPPISSAVKLLPANRGAFDRWNIPNVACYDASGGLVLSKMWIFQVNLGWFPADWWLDMTSRFSKNHWPELGMCVFTVVQLFVFFWLDCSWLFQSLGHNGFQHFQVCMKVVQSQARIFWTAPFQNRAFFLFNRVMVSLGDDITGDLFTATRSGPYLGGPSTCWQFVRPHQGDCYPLVNIQKTMEHRNFQWVNR